MIRRKNFLAITLLVIISSISLASACFADAGKPLNIAFIWNEHQPLYKSPTNGEYLQPGVRLHTVKDYYDMVNVLKNYPKIKLTFNIVPSLMYQINDYVYNGAKDVYQKVTLVNADSLTSEQKEFLVSNFFNVSPKAIASFARYQELAGQRSDAASKFTTQDYLDLQVLFNLAWIDPKVCSEDAELKALVDKGSNYTEADKTLVIRKQLDIMKKVLGIYKDYQKKGQIEVSTTPYYYPHMPLVTNTDFAIRANEDLELGDVTKERFDHPEDIEVQLDNGVDYYKKVFGVAPKGLWPAEQAVAPENIAPTLKAGFTWWVTNDGILAKSLGNAIDKANNPNVLYKAYYVKKGKKKIATLFRDSELSDKIANKYGEMKAEDAVNDFINSLHEIQAKVVDKSGNYVVTIALDSENCWGQYDNDGWDFISALYDRLSNDATLKTVTVSEYLTKNAPKDEVANLWSGSWINDNFEPWIAKAEANAAWGKLRDTRNFLVEFGIAHSGETKYDQPIKKAYEEIYAAENADWFTAYGSEQDRIDKKDLDTLFLAHLRNVYIYLGQDLPDSLK